MTSKNLDKCPECKTKVVHESGCASCPNCGWGACT
jgi:uncharacterized Zn finger protein (UPF0148 family)